MPLCPQTFDHEFEFFADEVKRTTVSKFYKARGIARRRSQASSIAYALDLLKRGSTGAIQIDKNGGFALVDKKALSDAKIEALSTPDYEEAASLQAFPCHPKLELRRVYRLQEVEYVWRY